MKKLIVIIALTTAIQSVAQTEEIDKICSETDERVALAEEDGAFETFPKIEVKSQLMKRAIGPVDHMITIYFNEEEKIFESNGTTETEVTTTATAQKIKFNITSVSYDITETYYYNSEGDLIKYVKDEKGYECSILTYYFEDEKVIRIVSKQQESEACHSEDETKEFDKDQISKDDQGHGRNIIFNSNDLQGVLRTNYDLIKD